MNVDFESVHVHNIDADDVIEAYRLKGFVLYDRTAPTIAAQPGFTKLIFVPEGQAKNAPRPKPTRRFGLF